MSFERPLLSKDHLTPVVTEQMATFHRDFVDEVAGAVETHAIVIVGMGQNPVVKKARRALDDAAIAYHYIGHGDYLSGYRRRLAIKMWSGYPTFPQVFVKGTLIGGCAELVAGLADGSVRARLV